MKSLRLRRDLCFRLCKCFLPMCEGRRRLRRKGSTLEGSTGWAADLNFSLELKLFIASLLALCPCLNVEWSSTKPSFPQPPGLVREQGQGKAIGGDERRVARGSPAAFSQTIKKVNSQELGFSAHASPHKFRMKFSMWQRKQAGQEPNCSLNSSHTMNDYLLYSSVDKMIWIDLNSSQMAGLTHKSNTYPRFITSSLISCYDYHF